MRLVCRRDLAILLRWPRSNARKRRAEDSGELQEGGANALIRARACNASPRLSPNHNAAFALMPTTRADLAAARTRSAFGRQARCDNDLPRGAALDPRVRPHHRRRRRGQWTGTRLICMAHCVSRRARASRVGRWRRDSRRGVGEHDHPDSRRRSLARARRGFLHDGFSRHRAAWQPRRRRTGKGDRRPGDVRIQRNSAQQPGSAAQLVAPMRQQCPPRSSPTS